MKSRPARDTDSTRIFEIRSEIIRTSDAILEDQPWSRERWDAWWDAREKALPFLVLADDTNHVGGYAMLAYFADRSGYRVTGEVSIHLDTGLRGQGYGRMLLADLVEAGRAFGFFSIISRITSSNAASIAIHEKLGFTRVGLLPKVARKFGNFVDVALYQKRFTEN